MRAVIPSIVSFIFQIKMYENIELIPQIDRLYWIYIIVSPFAQSTFENIKSRQPTNTIWFKKMFLTQIDSLIPCFIIIIH